MFRCKVAFVMSQAVSVKLQKNGGDSVHPIGSTSGKATKGGSPGNRGKQTLSLGTPDVANGMQ